MNKEIYEGDEYDHLLLGHMNNQRKTTRAKERLIVFAEQEELEMEFLAQTGRKAFPKFEVATFGVGSFYVADALFRRLRGVKTVITGYAGGESNDQADINEWPVRPSNQIDFEEISDGTLGHAQVVQVYYDQKIISYA
jgi:hypothetical protein